MRNYLLVILFLTGISPVWAQRVLVEPYVVGLVEDFGGRKVVKDNPKEAVFIDRFHHTEGKLVRFIDSLVTENNKLTYDKTILTWATWEKENCYYCHEFKLLSSDRLADIVNDAYSFKWKKEVNEQEQKIYVGELKPKAFKTPKEKASFLAGVFVRYGLREADQYTFKMYGTASKFDAVLRELKELRCNIKEVKVGQDDKASQEVTFEPTELLQAYLDKQDKMRRDILAKKNEIKQKKLITDVFTDQ